MELLAIVDKETLEPTGELICRDKCHKYGFPHNSVHTWIFTRDDEGVLQLLLQKRSESKECFPGYWDISSAGHVSGEDTVEETVHKELYEELGIQICQNDKQHIYVSDNYNVSNNGKFVDNELAWGYVIYIDDLDLDRLTLEEGSVDDVCLVDYDVFERIAHEKYFKFDCSANELDMLFDWVDSHINTSALGWDEKYTL